GEILMLLVRLADGGALHRILVGHLCDLRRDVRYSDGLRNLLAAEDPDASPDGARAEIEMLADAQERERPLAVVAPQPAERLTQDLPALRSLRDSPFAAHGDGVLEDGRHQALLACPHGAPLQAREVLHRQDDVRLEQAGELLVHLLRQSLHSTTSLVRTHDAARVPWKARQQTWEDFGGISGSRPGRAAPFLQQGSRGEARIDATQGAMQEDCSTYSVPVHDHELDAIR